MFQAIELWQADAMPGFQRLVIRTADGRALSCNLSAAQTPQALADSLRALAANVAELAPRATVDTFEDLA